VPAVPRIPARLRTVAVPALAALVLGALGVAARGDERPSNLLFFAAWGAASLLLFALALRLPLRLRGPRYRTVIWNGLLAGGALVVTWLANVAVFHHDVHFDLTREGANTLPPQLESVVDGLTTDVSLTYFYNSADENALKVTDLLAIASRQNPHFRARAVDLDKEPAMARRFGIRAYNSAVLEAEDRRVVVENTVDPAQMAYAALRALKKRTDVVCFVTGHGEAFSATPAHFHYSHVETLKGHDVPGAGDVLVGAPDGLDRLQLALTTLGYAVRAIVPATLAAVPADCAVVADVGPKSPYAPGEARLIASYLAGGGRLLLMIDPAFPIQREFADFLAKLGLASDQAIVIDPLNHYGADGSKVAVPYYPPHPITDRVAMTIFPDARPIRLGSAPAGVRTSVLASSSADSYLRSLPRGAEDERATLAASAKYGAAQRHPAVLAVAVEGHWPDAPATQDHLFRCVLVGNSNFASNAFFPYVSNGDLAVAMVRWLAGDEAMPAVKPQSFSLEQIDLTNRQMRDIFVVVELALPLTVILFGGAVWWRRR
jgi:ABC-2 type transport system permease protein